MTVDKRRTTACLKACEGISTQNLEDNVPVLELARRYNVVLRERDALRAKIEQMERQEPVATAVATHKPGEVGACTYHKETPFGSTRYALRGAQQCKNCIGMGDRFDPSGEKIPCDLCESHLEEIRSLVAEAAHDIISGSDFWLSISLAAKKIYALPGTQNVPKEAIAKILTEVMDIATSNGADSRSMPDEYVEVAAWLCGIPTHTATSVPENYFGMTLHDKIEAMENKL